MQKRDKRKDKYLISRGYYVLHFSESELNTNVSACIDKVEDEWDRIRPRRIKPKSSRS
jgi:very-short-patch-repair endonuclease